MPSRHCYSALTPNSPLPLLWPLSSTVRVHWPCLSPQNLPVSCLCFKRLRISEHNRTALVKPSSHKHGETSGKQTRTLEESVSQVVRWVGLVGNAGMGRTLAMFPYIPFGFGSLPTPWAVLQCCYCCEISDIFPLRFDFVFLQTQGELPRSLGNAGGAGGCPGLQAPSPRADMVNGSSHTSHSR